MFITPEVVLFGIAGCGVAIISYLVYSTSGELFVQISTASSYRSGVAKDTTSKSAFQATRLTPSTFLIKEYDDIYSEHPHIYAKVLPSAGTVLVVDTGCGGASNNSDIKITSLREFIETVPLKDNGDRPLNDGGLLRYVVVTTHCHYDHILGVEHFGKDSPILASSHSPSFLAPSALPDSSLCTALGIKTPSYTPTLVPHLHPIIAPDGDHPLGVTILHTPGHTPDELALYDKQEMMLYVGDSLYEYEPIIFPREGSIVVWFTSVDYLISFVREQNRDRKQAVEVKEVLINAGHRTIVRPALGVLLATKRFMKDVVEGREKVKERMKVRGEETVVYQQDGGRFSLRCPERLVLAAREVRMGESRSQE